MPDERPQLLDRIVQDPQNMVGNLVIRGARIPVELVLGHLAQNPDLTELFASYPHLTLEDIQACFAYAQTVVASKHQRPHRKRVFSAPPVS